MLCEMLSEACMPSMCFYVIEVCGSYRRGVVSVGFEHFRRSKNYAAEDIVSLDYLLTSAST